MLRSPRTPKSPPFRKCVAAPLMLGAVSLLTGCGNLTAGGLTGEAEVAVSGDVPGTQGSGDRIDPMPPSFVAAASSDNEPEGEVEVEFLLFLEGADGTSLALSDEEIRVRVDLRGRQEADVVSRQIPSKRYTGLRIVFTEIEAEVDSGLVINGQVISGAVEVRLEDISLTVLRPLSLEVGEGERMLLLIDLNAAVWLEAVNPDLNQVAEDFFAEALNVVVR